MKRTILLAATIMTVAITGHAHAATAEYTITMKNGGFEPASLNIPKDTKVHLTVINQEDHEVEFESYDLNQEQKIKAGQTVDMYVGPLNAGAYPIFDDKNPKAKGTLVSQ